MEESKKNQEIIDKINLAISELVYDKNTMMKAYNYYHGRRDPEQYRHLEENYGIGTSTSVEFVPLVKKHIDVLLGEYLSTPLKPKISCKDEETLSSIFRDKQKALNKSVFDLLQKQLKSSVHSIIRGGAKKEPVEDGEILKQIETLKEALDRNFISDYEIAGQNIIEHIIQSRDVDFKNELKMILTDLLVSGTCYYRTKPSPSNTNFVYKALNPLNTFVDRNPTSPYLKKSQRAVIREHMTKDQILAEYGDLLKKSDLDELNSSDAYNDSSSTEYFRTVSNSVNGTNPSDGILGGFEVSPLLPYNNETSPRFTNMHPVYEVEWLQTDKEGKSYIVNRYRGVRIGTNIYIPFGKVDVVRSMNDPKNCSLSINGMFYSDRNGEPFSLMLATANLQDKYDVLCFYRDNLIASSGTVGDWIDVAHLPKFLGADMAERLMKWEGYAKGGKKLYDSSQEGSVVNTAFNGFDDTIKVQAIQGIELAITRVEETCSTITGVFRERLGGIEQRDAVSNVAVGVKNSSLITKPYYHMMDLITRESLLDLLDLAKIVYKKGVSGTLVLGDRLNKIFTALPEHYTTTDFDIHITDSSDSIIEEETIKELTMEFAKGGLVDPDIIIEAIGTKSLTAMKSNVSNALAKKKKETDQTQQMGERLQEMDSQLQETTKQAEELQKEVERLNAEKLKLEQSKNQFEQEIGWYKAKADKEFKDQTLDDNRKRIELEGIQLLDDDGGNDKVRNS